MRRRTQPGELTLPEPGRELWLRTRDILKRGLETLGGTGLEYRIGGGTILAARWKHRISRDIDISVDTGAPLKTLTAAANAWFEREVRETGGEPNFDEQLNLYSISFGDSGEPQRVELWARSPLLAHGHAAETVEGRSEVVLSTAQILRGKLERAHKKLARDVYDIRCAEKRDPESLQAAVNTLPHSRLETLALDWYIGRGRIARYARERVNEIGQSDDPTHEDLAGEAGGTILRARYARFRMTVHNGQIVIETETRDGRRRRITTSAEAAGHDFEAHGINGHLGNKGPGADAIRQYATTLAKRGAQEMLVFEEENDEATLWRTATVSGSRQEFAP